jgi:hypothetical protein
MLARPWLRDNRVPACVDPEVILEQFTRIFATPVEPVARRRALGRRIGLHRIPAELASIRRRIKRKWWKLTRTA